MGVHDGHRERLRQRFLRHGLDSFDDHNVLELLLFYCLPRRDTNELAHHLLERFGSLAGVFDARYEELLKTEGIGENAALLLTLIPQIDRRYHISKEKGARIQTSEDAGRYLVERYRYTREEVVYLLCLDSKNRLIHCREVGRGSLNEANVSIRTIVETALGQNAAAVIISHNHVDGFALPSREDEITTARIQEALLPIGIKLVDHIIVCGDDFVSFADSGLLRGVGFHASGRNSE